MNVSIWIVNIVLAFGIFDCNSSFLKTDFFVLAYFENLRIENQVLKCVH